MAGPGQELASLHNGLLKTDWITSFGSTELERRTKETFQFAKSLS